MFGGTTVITAAGFRGLRQISRNMSLKKDLEKNSKPEQKCKKKVNCVMPSSGVCFKASYLLN